MKSRLLLLLAICSLPYLAGAQRKSTSAPVSNQVADKKSYDPSTYASLQWRLVGPFRGGRSNTVTGIPDNNNLYYMGTAGGGVWRTQDAGSTWDCISDGYFGGSIGAVAVAPSDHNVLYVGEGEQTIRGNVSSGWGLWRSTDAGKTWKSIGLKESYHIGRIRVHPTNPDLVYVAAMGNLWKPNDMRGVYRSTDGGRTWQRILFESNEAGAVDLILDPNNPRIIYASTWQVKRNGYRLDSGGPGSHLWKSTDGGDTWEKLTHKPGFTKGVLGIIGIAVSPVNSERLWAIVEADAGGVFRSDDAGETWIKVNEDRALRQRAWYYSRIYADTQNEDMVYVMNVSYHRSKDGGKTFETFNAPHGDHHDLWIDPHNNKRMIIADDGGGQVSNDGGENWTTYYNQPTAQFYRVVTDNHFPYRIYGAQQDNSTVRIAHRTAGSNITERDWESTAGGESAHLAPDPDNPDVVYGGNYKGYMMRMDHRTGQERSTNVWPINPAGSGAEVMKYRFNWNFPIFFSPHDGNKLYVGSNYLHVSYNEGQSWQVISPDLTRNDPETIKSSGGPITQDNTGVEYYATIFAVAESPLEKDVIYAGSDDGLVHITRDGGQNWTNITPAGSPKWNMMNCIDIHPTRPGWAYLAATSYKFGDYSPYLYKTKDYGKTWTLITKGIDPLHFTRSIRADPNREGLLYAGTEWGLYISFDDGANWQPWQSNLPTTSIRDMTIRDKSLIAATHGRSFWMIDDLSPLHQLSDEITNRDFYLFQPKANYRMAQDPPGRRAGKTVGENHPNGVQLQFFIKDLKEDEAVSLEIAELNGTTIQTFSNKDNRNKLDVKTGGNRFVWDMRYPGFKTFPGMILYSSPNQGPKAMPGKYLARLKMRGQTVEQTFEVLPDPRLSNTAADYKNQFEFLVKVRDRVSEAHQAILDIRSLKRDLEYLREKSKDQPETKEIQDLSKEIEKKMSEVENLIHETKNKSVQDPINYGIRVNNRLAFLLSDQQRGDFPPTDQAEQVYQELSNELGGYLRQWENIRSTEIKRLSDMAREKGLSIIQAPEPQEVK